jgi:hypothetical protein
MTMKADNIGDLVERLKQDYERYRSKCIFRIQIDDEQIPTEHDRKCLVCDGYRSRIECLYYTDILHMIKFYEIMKGIRT